MSFMVPMTAHADHGHFDPTIGLRWPVVADSRSGGNQGWLTAVSALSATARAANSY
jgi:hypothetical protein